MKKFFPLLLFSAFLVFTSLQAQNGNQNPASSGHKRNVQIPIEKVYLHLDRPFYSAGDDIWFKAYLVDALNNKLYNNSNNLNIELISPESKIVRHFAIRLDNGTGVGDIHLGDSIPSGTYQICAYTNWMRNFNDEFSFKKEIVIENPLGLKIVLPPVPKTDKNKIDVQFFPEGGPLVENVYTLLGFKAVSFSGYGIDIKGKVISSQGDSVGSFASAHLGMGSFNFIPKKGLTYIAVGTADDGSTFRTEIPVALKTGYSIRVSDVDNSHIRVTIKTNQETLEQYPGRELIVVGSCHNLLCLTAKTRAKALINTVTLPKNDFPEGIARITLMDTTGITYCERIYYVRNKENYQIKVSPDSKVYAPRQKVTLQISVKDTANKPVAANLSLSVVDGNQVRGFDKQPDIKSYLLFESEIHGHIEQPYYYFDTTNTDCYKALDNLLLTQGWRNFVWKYLSDSVIKMDYPI
ncbi:MAG TPA: hypothetical protein VIH57_17580, partial [Bacteroidales bacterium]